MVTSRVPPLGLRCAFECATIHSRRPGFKHISDCLVVRLARFVGGDDGVDQRGIKICVHFDDDAVSVPSGDPGERVVVDQACNMRRQLLAKHHAHSGQARQSRGV